MSSENLANIFISGFVIVAIVFLFINAWMSVIKTVSAQKYGKKHPNSTLLVPYLIIAIIISITSIVFILFTIRKYSNPKLKNINSEDLFKILSDPSEKLSTKFSRLFGINS